MSCYDRYEPSLTPYHAILADGPITLLTSSHVSAGRYSSWHLYFCASHYVDERIIDQRHLHHANVSLSVSYDPLEVSR